jgi:Xaa-Pro dipeptidase
VTNGFVYPFTAEEFRGRLKGVREGMRKIEIDLLLVTDSTNIYYLTGYHNSGQESFQCLVVPVDGDPKFVLRQLYFTAVAGLSWIKTGIPVPDTESLFETTLDCLRGFSATEARIGYDHLTLSLPGSILDGLRTTMRKANFVPSGGIVEECRMIKSEQELQYMRTAAILSVEGMEAGIAQIQPGKTENDFAAAAYNAMIRGGSDYLSCQPIVVAGSRIPPYRTVTAGRTFKPGEIVWYEGSANVRRYGAPIMRTISVGRPSPEVKRISDLMIKVLDAILAAVKPGVTCGQVDLAGRSLVEEAGLGKYWLHRTGYSVGASFPPNWGEGNVIDLKPNDPRVLRPNMVFHTVPWLLLPGIGSVGNSETWRVTEDGIEILTNTPRVLRTV